MIRVGLVDFDTSHVAAFTQRLNHVGVGPEEWVEGAKVVVGFPGDSEMMPERIPGYVEQLTGYGVPLAERSEDLMGQIDAVMITSQQGARHLERARPFLQAGLPTFIDKPFAGNAADAEAIIALSEAHNAPLMSCSALRWAPEVQDALQRKAELGAIVSTDVWTTAMLHPGNPGLLQYSIHGVEMLYALMGTGCKEVRAVSNEGGEVVTGVWSDGRIATVRGIRDGAGGFGFTTHYDKGHHAATVQGGGYYREMLKQIVGMFTTREEPIAKAEIREIIAFCDAAAESIAGNGAPVPVR
jgi:predicted dehydrogenase